MKWEGADKRAGAGVHPVMKKGKGKGLDLSRDGGWGGRLRKWAAGQKKVLMILDGPIAGDGSRSGEREHS